MMTFITRRGEGQGRTKKGRKATKSEGSGLEEGASRALVRQYGGGFLALTVTEKKKTRVRGHQAGAASARMMTTSAPEAAAHDDSGGGEAGDSVLLSSFEVNRMKSIAQVASKALPAPCSAYRRLRLVGSTVQCRAGVLGCSMVLCRL